MEASLEPASLYQGNYLPYLNRTHSYRETNCLSLIAEFYEKELGISWEEERQLFNNFNMEDLRSVMRIPIERIYALKNWSKISLTDMREFDILIYTRKDLLSHFSMYAGNLKILDLRENKKSALKHWNDNTRDNLAGIMRHKQLVT